MKVDRRAFLSASAAAIAITPIAPIAKGSVKGANDRVIAAFVGVGGMGRANLSDFMLMKDVSVAAVCDVWEHNRSLAAKMTETQSSGQAKAFSDFRQVLDLKEVDVVVISTPDHWHALPAVLACEAGKDVYVEKPLAHNIHEGRKMLETALRCRRIVQMGTQQRSGKHYQEAFELIRSGEIGKISQVKTWNYLNESPGGIGNPPDGDPPKGLDWDMYLGPAPSVPFNSNRFIYNFRWFWDYAGGMMCDWGTHHIDSVHAAMGASAPLAVSASGGKYYLKDNRQTPDTLQVVYEYPGFLLTYSHRALNARSCQNRGYGIEFYGTQGTLFLDRAGYEIYPETRNIKEEPIAPYLQQMQEDEKPLRPWERPRTERRGRSQLVEAEGSEQHVSHIRNFVDCVKSRAKPNSDIESSHFSTTAAHLGNIALKTGRKIRWDAQRGQILEDPEANKLLRRSYRKPWDYLAQD